MQKLVLIHGLGKYIESTLKITSPLGRVSAAAYWLTRVWFTTPDLMASILEVMDFEGEFHLKRAIPSAYLYRSA